MTIEKPKVPTQFISAEVALGKGLSFWIDGNSKVTWANGTYEKPKPNAFSLPHIATCPGSTPRCRESCYVHGLKKNAPEVYRLYELNELTLHTLFMGGGARMQDAAATLAAWIEQNASGGFRWHNSGDVFSYRHANWIKSVCEFAPDVNFWIYTRTLNVVPVLVEAKNLAVNVSVDKHNWVEGSKAAFDSGARLCYLVSEIDEVLPALPEGSVIFPDYPLRGRSLPIATDAPWWKSISIEQKRMTCPVDFFGQSEENRCGRCVKCLFPATVSI
jgi:hypothetical protein